MTAEVAAFVAAEARLLDDCDFGVWLALYAAEARCWMPVSPEQRTPTNGPMHFHDDKQLMMARTHRVRLCEGNEHGQGIHLCRPLVRELRHA